MRYTLPKPLCPRHLYIVCNAHLKRGIKKVEDLAKFSFSFSFQFLFFVTLNLMAILLGSRPLLLRLFLLLLANFSYRRGFILNAAFTWLSSPSLSASLTFLAFLASCFRILANTFRPGSN